VNDNNLEWEPLDDAHRKHLAEQLARGRAVLVSGAGFSAGALSTAQEPLPLPSALRDLLWDVAFPGEAPDEGSTLAEVFQVAASRRRQDTERVIREALTVDPDSLSETYRIWFSLPWSIHYTLNLDNLDMAAGRRFDLPRRIKSISGLRWDLPVSGDLVSVHLNGVLDDFPDVVFSAQQYARRAAGADPWYAHLIADISSHAVVFVGTTLNEPPLWSHVELRGLKRGHRELRPRSYLVTPALSRARAAMLEQFNVVWVPMTQEEFANEILASLVDDARPGFDIVARDRTTEPTSLVQSIADLRGGTHEDARSFCGAVSRTGQISRVGTPSSASSMPG